MLHLNSLRALEAVGRSGSFVAAGRELGVTPGAVSHKVRQLERYLGVTLLTRRGRAVEITAPAKQILPDLERGFAAVEQAWQRLHRTQSCGVSLTLPPSIATRWLMPRLDGFRSRHPKTTIRLLTSEALLDLELDGIDFAIRFGPARHAQAGGLLLARETFIPVCAPRLLHSSKRTSIDLRCERLIHDRTLDSFAEVPTWTNWLSQADMRDRDGSADLHVDASALAIQAALAGTGVALARRLLVADELRAGTLVAPFGHFLQSPFSYYLMCRRRRAGAALHFREWLIRQFEAERKNGYAPD